MRWAKQGGQQPSEVVATTTLTPPETMMFSVPHRSQRTLLLFSVVVCVQIYSVLAESSVLAGKPIYVSSHIAFRFQVEAERNIRVTPSFEIQPLTPANYTHVGDRHSRMLDGAKAF